jgi:hypothetical protein
MADIEQRLAEIEMRQRAHGEVLAAMESLTTTVHNLSEQLADLQLKVGLDDDSDSKGKSYKPAHTPHWWDLSEKEKAAEVGRIRGWYRAIAEPFLGTRGLPKCVLEHDIAVLALDPVAEIWKHLWLTENRTAKIAASQCEFLIRIWPGIRAELIKVLSGCDHQSGMPSRAVGK